jgi:hypothetical protein
LKIINQTLLENFQSNLAEKISIKVRLPKVKLILSSNKPGFTTKQPIRQPVFNQRSLEKFQSKSAENFSIKPCLKNKNQSLIDPDRFFNHDHDCDWKKLPCRKHGTMIAMPGSRPAVLVLLSGIAMPAAAPAGALPRRLSLSFPGTGNCPTVPRRGREAGSPHKK